MVDGNKEQWESFANWNATAFLVGGLLMVANAAMVTVNIVTGDEGLLVLGQAFFGAAWTAALVGLLGLYPGLVDRSRWLSRAGAVFAAIGVVVFAIMAVTSLVYYLGIPAGEYSNIGQFFIPGVLIGSVLGFGSFSAAVLRTGAYSRTVGVLLLIPPILVGTNILRFIAGMEAVTLSLAYSSAEAVVYLSIGYLLRTEGVPTDRTEPAPGEVRHG
jgi:hypothetical protein